MKNTVLKILAYWVLIKYFLINSRSQSTVPFKTIFIYSIFNRLFNILINIKNPSRKIDKLNFEFVDIAIDA